MVAIVALCAKHRIMYGHVVAEFYIFLVFCSISLLICYLFNICAKMNSHLVVCLSETVFFCNEFTDVILLLRHLPIVGNRNMLLHNCHCALIWLDTTAGLNFLTQLQ